SFSDQNRGALTASFIFAKKSAGDSAQGEAGTDNSSRSKGVVRDAPRSVAHAAARESFSDVSAGPPKAVAGKPDPGSEKLYSPFRFCRGFTPKSNNQLLDPLNAS